MPSTFLLHMVLILTDGSNMAIVDIGISEHIIDDGACLKLWDWKSWQLHYGVNMEVDEVQGEYFFYIAVDVAYSRFMLHLLISGLQKQFWTLKMTLLVPYLKYAFSFLCLMDPEFWNWHLPPMLDVQRLLL
jgi:hypothetical protein